MATRNVKKNASVDDVDVQDAPEPGSVDVDLEDDPEPEDAPDPAGGPSRAEKKAERGRLREEAEAARRERDALSRELAEARAAAAAANGFAHGLREATGQGQKDPLDVAEEEVDQQNNALIREYQAVEKTLTDAQRDQYRTRASAIEKRKLDLRIARHNRSTQPNDQQRAAQANNQLLMARYPDVCSNQRALNWATLEYQKAVLEGQPDGWDTTEAVMRRTRAQFKMGDSNKRQVDPVNRTRLAGQSSGASGGGSSAPKVMRLSQMDKDNADAAYPSIKDEKTRYIHYAKKITERRAARGEE